jgi:hypothetical protein
MCLKSLLFCIFINLKSKFLELDGKEYDKRSKSLFQAI